MAKESYKLQDVLFVSSISPTINDSILSDDLGKDAIGVSGEVTSMIMKKEDFSFFNKDHVTLSSLHNPSLISINRKDYELLAKRGFFYYDPDSMRNVVLNTIFKIPDQNGKSCFVIGEDKKLNDKSSVLNIYNLESLFCNIMMLAKYEFDEHKELVEALVLDFMRFYDDYVIGRISKEKLDDYYELLMLFNIYRGIIFEPEKVGHGRKRK